ncbi:MAG: hypothetical protein KUG80_03125 [Gammaproteobacteria bacterium]|nr:hypothetical protein [Gammaproteobacteria bacterium]
MKRLKFKQKRIPVTHQGAQNQTLTLQIVGRQAINSWLKLYPRELHKKTMIVAAFPANR